MKEICKQMTSEEDKRNIKDLLEKIFTYDPRQRIPASRVVKHPFFSEIAAEFERSR